MTFLRDRISLFIKEYKYTILIYILLFIFSFLFRGSLKGFNAKSVVFAILNAFVIFFAFFFFARTFLRIPVVILLSVIITFESGLFYVYHNPMNYGVIASIIATNFTEAIDMIKIALPFGLLTLVMFGFLLYKSSTELKKVKNKKVYFSIPIIIIILFIYPPFSFIKEGGMPVEDVKSDLRTQPATLYYSLTNMKYPFIISDLFLIASYYEHISKFKKEANKPKSLPAGVMLEKEGDFDKIIVVIGESAVDNHLSLYGYPLKTTPFLDSLSVKSNLLSYYKNVIAPAPYTLESLRISLSFSTALDIEPFFEKKNIFHLAKDAGYETAWVSSLPQFGISNSAISEIASNADIGIYEADSVADDLGLKRKLSPILKNNKKQFIALHLIGSHLDYKRRYDAVDSEFLGFEGETIDYDKTIHHTDRVLSSIFNLFKNEGESVLIYYFSDHGEVINKGHAIPNRYKVQYQIPLVALQNKETINTDSIILKYYNTETGRLSTSSNIYILSEILGYSVDESLIKKARIDGEYLYQPYGTPCLYEQIKK